VFDRESAAECVAELKSLPRVASGRCKVAAIGMRLDARTKANEVLAAWAEKLDLPYIGVLRETQAYVRCIEVGLTLFDVPATQVRTDLAQWRPILEWLEPVLTAQPATTTAPRPILPAPPVAASEPAPVKPLGVTRPVVAPTRPAPRPPSPAPQPRPVVARPEPARPAIGERLGQLLVTLPIPRFLQRNP
jgi:chromosome partitioning protein